MTKTREDVEELKRQWRNDPCWDIEETEGFEEYRAELAAYHAEVSREADARYKRQVMQKAHDLACSPALAEYIMRLERRVDSLEQAAV